MLSDTLLKSMLISDFSRTLNTGNLWTSPAILGWPTKFEDPDGAREVVFRTDYLLSSALCTVEYKCILYREKSAGVLLSRKGMQS